MSGCVAPTPARAETRGLHDAGAVHTFPSSPCRWAGAATRIAFIHVGKTAGESVKFLLDAARVNHTWIHELVDVFDSKTLSLDWRPALDALRCEFSHYIVMLRDPADRVYATAGSNPQLSSEPSV